MPAPVLPVDYNALRITLVRAAVLACGFLPDHVIMSEPEQPNMPRPSLPYMTVKFISPSMRYGSDCQAYDAQDLTWQISGPRACNVSFNIYGNSHEESYSLMALWQASLESPPIQYALGQGGLASQLPGPVRDLSALLTTGFEGRAQMDVVFGLASNLLVDLGQMLSISATGTVPPSSDTVTVTPAVSA